MAIRQSLIRTSTHICKSLRPFSTTAAVAATTAPTHHRQPPQDHTFLDPNSFIGSWKPPKDPKEAEARLAQLRRDYAKQVKGFRKQYIREVELLRLEKQRKDELKKEAIRAANEERRKLKAEAAKVRAEERKVADEELRQTLLKERTEKLENWRMKETRQKEKKKEKEELLRKQSSLWIDEGELEKKLIEVMVDTKAL